MMEPGFSVGGVGGFSSVENGVGRVGNGAIRSATLGPPTQNRGGVGGGGPNGPANRRNSVFIQNGNHYPNVGGGVGGGGVVGAGGVGGGGAAKGCEDEEEETDPLRKLTKKGSQLFESFRSSK